MHITVVVNPAAGGGRGQRISARLRPLLLARGVTDIRVTRASGDEARLTAEAVADGATTILAVGGDGTWSRCAAVLGAARSGTTLALLAAGRGNDFAKTLRLPVHDHIRTLDLVQQQCWRPCDLGRVDDTWFLNVAGFGFDAHVLARAQRAGGGVLAYARVALRELAAYQPLQVAVDDGPSRDTLILAVANGAFFGGTFHVAPGAAVDDGRLDVVHIGDLPPLRRLPLLAAAVRGRHLQHAAAQHGAVVGATLTFAHPPVYEADGELHQAAACTVRVGVEPGALRLVAP
jgi:diacylglycerol kinase (ATP)